MLSKQYVYNLARVGVAFGAGLVTVAEAGWGVIHWRGTDFADLRAAAIALLAHRDPYSVPAFLAPVPETLPYIPVALLPLDTASWVWRLVMLTAIPLLLWLVCRAIGLRLPLWCWPPALLAALIFCSTGWLTGQPTILIALAVVAGLALRSKYSGFSWWLLILKPQITAPVAIVLFCMRGRTYRRAALDGVTLAAMLCVFFAPAFAVKFLMNAGHMQNFGAQWWTTSLHDFLGYIVPALYPYYVALYAGIMAAGISGWLWAFLQWRRGVIDSTTIAALTIALCYTLTPYSRDYDFPLLLLPYFWLWHKSQLLPIHQRLTLQIGLILFPLPYLAGGAMPGYWLMPALLSVACMPLIRHERR